MTDDLTTPQLLERLGHRITPRQLQEWIRRDYITIDTPATGSGTQHRYSPAEVDAIADLVDMIAAVNTGSYYRDRLNHHLTR